MNDTNCPPTEARRHTRPRDIYRSNELFRRIATKTSHAVGHPLTFVAAISTVVVWAASGKLFGFSDTWQLVINTGTTIVTFLMVFLIQNTQNRDSHAIHLKLDELIRANRHARNRMMMLEELPEDELDALQKEFDERARDRVAAHRQRQRDSRDSFDQEPASSSSSRSSRSPSRIVAHGTKDRASAD